MAELTFNTTRFANSLRNLSAISSRSFQDELKFAVRAVIRETIKITPPANGGSNVAASRKLGEGAIIRDLTGGGFGRGKRRAGVFTILNDGLIHAAMSARIVHSDYERLWVTKTGRVYGTQRNFFKPNASLDEMSTHHKRFFKNGRMSKAGTFTRDVGRWKWIDQMVVKSSTFNKFKRAQIKKVGTFASGFNPVARAVGAKIPMYMKRHQGRGFVEVRTGANSFRVKFRNDYDYPRIEKDVKRRMQFAIDKQARKMEKAALFVMKRHAKSLGLKAR